MMTKRINKNDYYLNIARAVSRRSTCLRRQYGAVIVKNDEIIATGYNGAPRGEENCCDKGFCPRTHMAHNSGDYSDCPAVHAEQNAMLSAPRKEMIGAKLYLAGYELKGDEWVPIPDKETSPCPICGRMIKNAGLICVTDSDSI